MDMRRHPLLVTTVKNEGPYLLEWIAHHRTLGIEDFIVFQNDSEDGTDAILSTLRDLGFVKYLYNRATAGKHQIRAYQRSARQEEYRLAEWVMALDIDEFLVLAPGLEHVRDWMALMPEADQIHVNWRLFGSSGKAVPPDGLNATYFTECIANPASQSHLNQFKTLFRRAAFERPGIHKPVPKDDSFEPVTINASGLIAPEFEIRNFRSRDPEGQRYAWVNHYITRDAASFVLKSDRGSAHQTNRDMGKTYWMNRNKNGGTCLRMADRADIVQDEMDRMDRASGGVLSNLSARARVWHRNKLNTLLAQSPDHRALFQFCLENPYPQPS